MNLEKEPQQPIQDNEQSVSDKVLYSRLFAGAVLGNLIYIKSVDTDLTYEDALPKAVIAVGFIYAVHKVFPSTRPWGLTNPHCNGAAGRQP